MYYKTFKNITPTSVLGEYILNFKTKRYTKIVRTIYFPSIEKKSDTNIEKWSHIPNNLTTSNSNMFREPEIADPHSRPPLNPSETIVL